MSASSQASLSQVELLYVKSKAYLHPTTSKKDNVAGFLSLSKPGGASSNKEILLSFTPESMLSLEELQLYQEVDVAEDLAEDLQALLLSGKKKKKGLKVYATSRPPTSASLGFCFSVALSYAYLIQFRTPSLGWWYGSIIVHTKSGEKLPVVFFHDDESPLTLQRQKVKNQRFDPFGDDGLMFWGGQDFLQALEAVIHTQQSTVEPTVYLVDPLSADLANFAPFGLPGSKELSKAPVEPFKLPDVNKFLATAKWKVLETVATLTLRTKNQVKDIVDEHVPEIVVRLIMNQKEVKKISNDFESAHVYLAKWAAQVKEEAEQAQRKFLLNETVYARINKELGTDGEILTPEEVNNASRRKPVSLVEWNGCFDDKGRLTVTPEEIKSRIFHGGLDKEVRKQAWPFLLGVFPWDSSEHEREVLFESLQSGYADYKRRWVDDDQKRQTEFWKDQKVRIEKDVHRNDRHLEIYQNKKPVVQTEDGRESSPETPDEDEEWDLANITNMHLFRLREILLTFNEYNVNLGYVQGMTDLLSPIYVVFQDETMTFWAFAGFMERMERNFLRDQSGMKRQMLVLNELVQFMLPKLFAHLGKCESTDLFFFFRMLLVWFKREFEWEPVNTLWEVLWTDYYSSQFHLFLALAVLSDNERIIMQNLRRFDEVLKYMNDLLGKLNLEDLLVRAELLFLRFKRMVDLIDRENALRRQQGELYEATVNPDLRQLLTRTLVVQKEEERPDGVGGG